MTMTVFLNKKCESMCENNPKTIRILHCVAGVGRGGYEALIMNVYRHIDTDKVQFDFLYSFDGVYKEEIEKLGGKLYKIPFITQCGPFAYANNLDKFFKEHPEYKIVHSHMDKFSGIVMKCAKKHNVPVRIAHSHNTANEGNFIYHIVKDYYGKMVNPNCTHRFACSDEAAKWMFKDKADSALIVKNGVDLSRFAFKDTTDKDKFTICCVARFTQQKNHSFLIDVFKKICDKKQNARLLLAGSGPLKKQTEQKAESLGLKDKVEFLGDVSDVPSLLYKSDVFCLPSLFEGLGIVFIEAQSCGVKCVASDNVPKEAKVSDDISFLSLDKGAQFWADYILNLDVSSKKDNSQSVRQRGYDIANTAKILEDFYIENWRKY